MTNLTRADVAFLVVRVFGVFAAFQVFGAVVLVLLTASTFTLLPTASPAIVQNLTFPSITNVVVVLALVTIFWIFPDKVVKLILRLGGGSWSAMGLSLTGLYICVQNAPDFAQQLVRIVLRLEASTGLTRPENFSLFQRPLILNSLCMLLAVLLMVFADPISKICDSDWRNTRRLQRLVRESNDD